MGLFSRFRKKSGFNLTSSDFKTESENFEVISIKISDSFYEKFPEAKRKKNNTGTSTLITNRATIILFDQKIDITYNPSNIELKESKFIESINQKLNWIAVNENKINTKIINDLLVLKNDNWLEDNEAKVSETEFIKRITLISITCIENGSMEIIYDDGDLFWEHQIVVNLNPNNKLTSANIRG